MKSTDSPKYEHLNSILTGYSSMSTRDMMKYVMLNADAITDEKTASYVMRLVVSKYLEINPPTVEQEFN